MKRLVWHIACALGCTAFAGSAAAIDITSCGQTIGSGETGVLKVDLACPIVLDPASFGVILANGGQLELDGHVLSGAFHAVFVYDGNPVIHGPGEITGSYSAGVSMSLGRLSVDDVDIHDNGGSGIALSSSSLLIRDAAVRDNGGAGVAWVSNSIARGQIRAANVDASGNGAGGLEGVKIKATDVNASGNGGDGLRADRLGVKRASVDGNGGFGLVASRVAATDVSANANAEAGILATRVRGLRVDANDNGGYGISGEKVQRLRDSTALGNGGYGTGVDLRSAYPPRVAGVVCGLSADYQGQPWGVCADDAP